MNRHTNTTVRAYRHYYKANSSYKEAYEPQYIPLCLKQSSHAALKLTVHGFTVDQQNKKQDSADHKAD